MAWTEQQQAAIEARDCGLIVSAAAGSGKTSVLVERLLQILMEDAPEKRIRADRMIVVTFTNDAAAEMKARLNRELDAQLQKNPNNRWLYEQQIRLQDAHISTISSFCFELIRDNLTNMSITSGFRILNDTESSLIAAKSADRILNRWHQEHPQEMQLLWDSFCERSDRPLEQILLELHEFLTSVPFREIWQSKALSFLEQPLERSVYHKALTEQMEQLTIQALKWAETAVSLAGTLYENVSRNKVLPWVEDDCRCFRLLLKQLKNGETDYHRMQEPFLEKNGSRNNYPRRTKDVEDISCWEQVRALRGRYVECEKQLLYLMQTVIPYEQNDLEIHRQILPLLLQMEQQLSDEISQTKVMQNALGFEDGEQLTLELLGELDDQGRLRQTPLAKEMAAYYQLIMVDEYQDSNNKQDCIFKLLSRNCVDPLTGDLRYGDNIFLVGDMKQSIYRFRLANPQNFMTAIKAAGEPRSVCQNITLNRNFRSVPAVLHFVNFVCGNLMSESCGDITYDENESLIPGAAISAILPEEEQNVEIAVLEKTSAEQPVQITYVIRQIENMILSGTAVAEKDGSTRPCTYQDFCILVRGNDHCRQYAHALEDAGIPVILPEEKGYLKAREISILLDMLRVLDNPLLDTALAAVMVSPMFWFTAEELMQIRMAAMDSRLYVGLCRIIGVTEADEGASLVTDMVLLKKCRNFYDTVQKLRQEAVLMPLESLIRRIYDKTDFLSVMQLTKDGAKKRANLNLLLQYAKQYEENTDTARSGLSGFLRYVDWLLESGNDFQQSTLSAGAENAVSVKTMHKSKGLEFPFVFLCELEHEFSTQDKRKNAVFSDSGMCGFRVKNPEDFTSAKTLPFLIIDKENERNAKSEELRLLYVAMTRAKQKLMIPLLLDKVRTTRTDYLNIFAQEIQSDGTLPASLVQSAGCMAHWIWMSLLLRHDYTLDKAVCLPVQTWQTPRWSEGLRIRYVFTLPEQQTADEPTVTVTAHPDSETVEEIHRMVQFSYASRDSSRRSLLSVSAIQEERNQRPPIWKRPQFQQERTRLTGAERGTAVHTFFQYADFQLAEQNPEAEIKRLQQYGYLTAEQADAVQPEIAEAFFRDPIYRRMRRSKRVLREQKFLVQCRDLSVCPDAEQLLQEYYNSDSMLKGIIDLAFQEDDSFILVDYKTDAVAHEQELIDSYREQLMLYQAALQCITNMPVRECWLYSTHLKRSIAISGSKE